MTKAIYFDMDGTIANFYGVKNWLSMLENENVYPYVHCRPLIESRKEFIYQLKRLQEKGYIIGVISWGSMSASKEYMKAIREAKKAWLKKYFPLLEWDEIHIVKYGTAKHLIPKIRGGILFDDNLEIRKKWNKYGEKNNYCGFAYDEKHILEHLRSL